MTLFQAQTGIYNISVFALFIAFGFCISVLHAFFCVFFGVEFQSEFFVFCIYLFPALRCKSPQKYLWFSCINYPFKGILKMMFPFPRWDNYAIVPGGYHFSIHLGMSWKRKFQRCSKLPYPTCAAFLGFFFQLSRPQLSEKSLLERNASGSFRVLRLKHGPKNLLRVVQTSTP